MSSINQITPFNPLIFARINDFMKDKVTEELYEI